MAERIGFEFNTDLSEAYNDFAKYSSGLKELREATKNQARKYPILLKTLLKGLITSINP